MTEITKSTITDNLNAWTEWYKGIFGNNFTISPESVISNIAVACSAIKMNFEDQMLFVKSMLNPYTTKGSWQDNLYSLIKLERRQATYTVVQRTISGTPNATITSGSLMIEDNSTKNQFKLTSNCTLDANGIGTGTFTSELSGAVELDSGSTLNILTPLATVTGVYYSAGNTDVVGVDYESDEEFRQRWKVWSESSSNLHEALLKIVKSAGDIIIEQNRGIQTHLSFPIHTIHCVVNSPASDEDVARLILDNTTDGVGFYGSITENILDSAGETVAVSFDRATPTNIYVKATVKKFTDNTQSEATQDTKDGINEYIQDASFQIGQVLVGNRFNSLIDAKPSIDYVVKTELSTDGTTWTDTITLGDYDIPVFDDSRITVVVT